MNVLILCTHNSARSILSEGMLNHWAKRLGKAIHAYSAGSTPNANGKPNPLALEVLDAAGVDTTGYASKSWDVFASDNAPAMQVVITVCDNAAKEPCPYWPGAPVRVHWGYPDPSLVDGSPETRRAAFELTRQAIGYRMLQLASLPIEEMDDAALRRALADIERS